MSDAVSGGSGRSIHQSILEYRGYRYLKWMLILMIASIVAYIVHDPVGGANGGTWLGYTLGGIGLALILWLTWFGVRKRRYNKGPGLLEDWMSGHIYLGLSLIVVATLHTGFQVGWNVHTLAYVLMLLVIVSGIFGLYAYLRYPTMMTQNRRGQTLEEILTQISEIDVDARAAAQNMGDQINNVVHDAAQKTRIGGGIRRQLSGRDKNCANAAALEALAGIERTGADIPPAEMRRLVGLLTRKNQLLRRARRDVQLKALMDIWLFVHVPLTIALIAALAAHVLSVFFYW